MTSDMGDLKALLGRVAGGEKLKTVPAGRFLSSSSRRALMA